jgi:hypothetical protein
MSDQPNVKRSSTGQVRIPRWEYMTMSYNYAYGSTTYEINGEKEGNLKNKPLFEILNQFGILGWELLTVAGAEAKVFVFKRQLVKMPDNGNPQGSNP